MPGTRRRTASYSWEDSSLWPWLLGRDALAVPDDILVEETIRMFLGYYRRR